MLRAGRWRCAHTTALATELQEAENAGARHQHPAQMREAHVVGHRGEAGSQWSSGWRSRRESTGRGADATTWRRCERRSGEQTQDGRSTGDNGSGRLIIRSLANGMRLEICIYIYIGE
jgi:hypothetical protein